MTEKFDSELVVAALEDAYRTLAALPFSRHSAAIAESSGEIVREYIESYGFVPETKRTASPPADKLVAMNEILSWLNLIPRRKMGLRRVVAMRSFNHPIMHRRLFSDRQIASAIGVTHRTIASWHAQGIKIIVDALNSSQGVQCPSSTIEAQRHE